jgi:hypothetical protein
MNTWTNLAQGSRRQDRGTGNRVANLAAQALNTPGSTCRRAVSLSGCHLLVAFSRRRKGNKETGNWIWKLRSRRRRGLWTFDVSLFLIYPHFAFAVIHTLHTYIYRMGPLGFGGPGRPPLSPPPPGPGLAAKLLHGLRRASAACLLDCASSTDNGSSTGFASCIGGGAPSCAGYWL